jgi:hypothetical protein
VEATKLIARGAAELIVQEAAELIAAVDVQEAAAMIAVASRHAAQNGTEVSTSAADRRAGSEARRRPN